MEKLHWGPVLNLAKRCHHQHQSLPQTRLHGNGKRANHRVDPSELSSGSKVTRYITLCDTSVYDIPKESSERWCSLDKKVDLSMKSLHGTEGAVPQSL